MDGHHVVFGEVIEGFNVVDKLESIGTKSGTPTEKAVIAGCGTLTSEPEAANPV